MKFNGEPIFATPPTTCGCQAADCPKHGFGLTMPRAADIVHALVTLAEQYRDEETGNVDFPRFMAGPDLDLQTPAEVLFAGFYVGHISLSLRSWHFEHSGQQALMELMRDVNANLSRKFGADGLGQE